MKGSRERLHEIIFEADTPAGAAAAHALARRHVEWLDQVGMGPEMHEER